MFSKPQLTAVALTLLSLSDVSYARYRWLERDGRSVQLYPRRFGEEHPAVIDKLAAACSGGICATLAGQAITPLLAAQGECTQQDMADTIIDAAQQFDATTKANMIALAVEYRQAEKNTPPDFSVQPNILRNSVFCQKAPKNAQLNGLVQAQDPANDPNVFFDPATSKSVQKGAQANTFPFGSSASSNTTAAATSAATSAAASSSSAASSSVSASSAVLVATSAASSASSSASANPCAVTVTVTAAAETDVASTSAAAATDVASTSSAAATAVSTASSAAIGNFGSCSVPQIEFGVGFDGRKETSFEPVDKTSYNHGSAQNIDIITQFMCDTLTNSCGADQTAKDTCQKARTAADTVTAKTGGQADAFNAVFGITTQFAAVASVDDQGRVIAGTGSGAAAASVSSAAAATVSTTANAAAATTTSAAAAAAAATSASTSTASSSAIGNFGSCSVPQIEFGVGFDGRKETSFEPVDKTSYNHGSADNIAVITQFMCDALTNTCAADQTAKATCQKAITAANGQTALTGAQADAFNAVFGLKTNFAAVAVVDNTGKVVSSGSSAAAATTANAAAATTTSAAAAATTSAAAASTSTASSSGIGNFGSCSVPQIEFATGFDGRKETSFQPVDKTSYNHGSAQNIDIITQFMCDTLTNSCGADQTAKNTCQTARAAADTKAAKTGAQADAFNAVFGITTAFSKVAAVDDQGNVIAGSTQ